MAPRMPATRRTLTLDPDVEALLRAEMAAHGLTLRGAVNAAVRRALKAHGTPRQPFVQRTFSLGLSPDFNWDKALRLAAELEDADKKP